MIELRWYECDGELRGEVIGYRGGTLSKPVQRILQYRTWSDTQPRSEWIDVPTVRSDAAPTPQEKKP